MVVTETLKPLSKKTVRDLLRITPSELARAVDENLLKMDDKGKYSAKEVQYANDNFLWFQTELAKTLPLNATQAAQHLGISRYMFAKAVKVNNLKPVKTTSWQYGTILWYQTKDVESLILWLQENGKYSNSIPAKHLPPPPSQTAKEALAATTYANTAPGKIMLLAAFLSTESDFPYEVTPTLKMCINSLAHDAEVKKLQKFIYDAHLTPHELKTYSEKLTFKGKYVPVKLVAQQLKVPVAAFANLSSNFGLVEYEKMGEFIENNVEQLHRYQISNVIGSRLALFKQLQHKQQQREQQKREQLQRERQKREKQKREQLKRERREQRKQQLEKASISKSKSKKLRSPEYVASTLNISIEQVNAITPNSGVWHSSFVDILKKSPDDLTERLKKAKMV